MGCGLAWRGLPESGFAGFWGIFRMGGAALTRVLVGVFDERSREFTRDLGWRLFAVCGGRLAVSAVASTSDNLTLEGQIGGNGGRLAVSAVAGAGGGVLAGVQWVGANSCCALGNRNILYCFENLRFVFFVLSTITFSPVRLKNFYFNLGRLWSVTVRVNALVKHVLFKVELCIFVVFLELPNQLLNLDDLILQFSAARSASTVSASDGRRSSRQRAVGRGAGRSRGREEARGRATARGRARDRG